MEKYVRMSSDYNKVSSLQNNIGGSLVDGLVIALKEMNESNYFDNFKGPFVVCELGCSLGSNSVKFLKVILEEIEKINKDIEIEIILEDTPFNNFEATLNTINKELLYGNNVKIKSFGKSFYEDLFDLNSVDLFFSSIAMHWLPYSPSNPVNTFCFFNSGNTTNEELYNIWERFSNECWLKQTELRAKELKKNGRLLTLVPSCPNEEYPIENKFKKDGIVLKNLLQEYKLDNIFDQISIPVSINKTEVLLKHSHSNLEILKWNEFSNKVISKEDENYSQYWADFTKSYSENIIKNTLIKFISKELTNEILEEFILRLKKEHNSEDFKIEYFNTSLICYKKK